MIFRDRGEERSRERLINELTPYHTMATDMEAEDRLQATNFDLEVLGHHLLSSNDRYQMCAAQLSLARNRALLARPIVDAYMSVDPSDDFRGAAFHYDIITSFVLEIYRNITTCIETADIINDIIGFAADHQFIDQFNALNASLQWPAIETISRQFLIGGLTGADNVHTAVLHHYEKAVDSSSLRSSLQFQLKLHINPLFSSITMKRKAIERMTSGVLRSVTSQQVMTELYDNLREIIRLLDEASVWVTMPKLYDAAFELVEPLDDRGRRKFDSSILGTVAVPKPPQPPPSGRPFQAEVIATGVPVPPSPVPPRPAKPFDLTALRTDEVSSSDDAKNESRPNTRPFDADAIKPRGQTRPFDPTSLDPDD